MSLSQQVAKTINDVINKFISEVSEKYNLDEQELKHAVNYYTKAGNLKLKQVF